MGAAIQRLIDFVFRPQLLWGATWAGLCLLTGALVLLMATRWGQTQPLRKCMILSLWAHLLLIVYASTVDIVFSPPAVSQVAGVIHVSAVDSEGVSDSSTAGKPWEQFASDSPAGMAQPDLARAAEPSAPNAETASASLPDALLKTLSMERVAAAVASLANAKLAVAEQVPERTDAKPAEPIKAPEAQRTDETKLATPRDPPLPKIDEQANASAGDSIPAGELPKEIVEPSSPLKHLPDVPSKAAMNTEPPAPTLPPAGPIEPGITLAPPGSSANATRKPNDSALDLVPLPLITPGRVGEGEHEAPRMYELRLAPDHAKVAASHGGSAETEAAVKAALVWLAKNQDADGRWDASRFGSGRETKVLGHDRKGAGAEADTGVTGLALLAFFGSGHTHATGDYREAVAKGLDFLVRSQAANGNLAGRAEPFAAMYCHGMAALALSEAYGMSGDERLLMPVQKAINYTLAAQNQTTGGWRYRPSDVGDTSQLGWQLMALKSAELAGLPIPGSARERMLRFLRTVSSGTHGGIASYRAGERPSRTMTAEALVCRQFLGMVHDNPAGKEAATYVLEELPTANSANLYYWYYGTLSMYQLQGEAWQRWNEAISSTLVASQRSGDALAGSWDPDPVWGGYGGRVYSTALAALCLEVYYRYLPLYVEAATLDRRVR